jgi:hypothetical protein
MKNSVLLSNKRLSPLYFLVPVTGLICFSSPAQSISFSTSSSNLELDNFSHIPESIGVNIDVEAIAISNMGSVETVAAFDSIFVSQDPQVFAQSFSETTVSGNGSSYFGKGAISSELVGEFFIAAEQDFSFNYQGSFNTAAVLNNPDIENSRTLVNISLLLDHNYGQEQIYDLSFISNSPQQSALSFAGQFQDSFRQDTPLKLYAQTEIQSCLHTFRDNSICDSPPPIPPAAAVPFQPAETLAILLTLGFFCFRLIKHQII